jgi:spermidine/putrescine transport system permease protein
MDTLAADTRSASAPPGPRPGRRPRRLRPSHLVSTLQLTPALVVLGLFIVAPLVVFAIYSVWELHEFQIISNWNIDNYKEAITSGVFQSLMWNTIKIAGMVAIATVTVGYTFAHILRFHLRRWQEPLLFLVIIASFSGYLVRIYAWRTILGENGIINAALEGIGVIDHPIGFLLYNRFATVIVLGNFLLPVAVLTIYAGLQNIDDREIEAARDLGAGAGQTLRRVTLPLAWPAIFAALALCFIFSAGDYLTPLLVGGTSGTMVGLFIENAFNAQFNWPLGAALSFSMLAIVLVVLGLVRLVGNRVLR